VQGQTVEQAVERAEGHAKVLMETLVQRVRPGEHDILIDAPLMVSIMAARSCGLGEERFAEVARQLYREISSRTDA